MALLLVVAVPAALYVGLSLPAVQDYARNEAGRRLSDLLGADVEVGNLSITPFNKATLRNVSVTDQKGDTLVKARRLGAGFGLTDLLFQHRLVLNYVEALGLDLRLSRDSAGAPLNIEPILARLNKPGGDGGVPDLRINTIVIRRSKVSYHVLSESPAPLGHFDPSHISIEDLRADLRLYFDKARREINVDLRRLAASETHSGFVLNGLATRLSLHKAAAPSGAIEVINLGGLELAMPSSRIMIGPSAFSVNTDTPARLSILQGSHICLTDLSAFVDPALKSHWANLFDSRINIVADAEVSKRMVNVHRMAIGCADGAVRIDAPRGISVTGIDSIPSVRFELPEVKLTVNPSASRLLPLQLHGTDSVSALVLPIVATIEGEGSLTAGHLGLTLDSNRAGDLNASIGYKLGANRTLNELEGSVVADGLGIAEIASVVERALGRSTSLPGKLPRLLTATVEGRANFAKGAKLPDGSLSASIARIDLNKLNGSPTTLTDVIIDLSSERGVVDAAFESANDGFALNADATIDLNDRMGGFELTLDDFDLPFKGEKKLSLTAFGQLSLSKAGAPLPATGNISLHDILLADRNDRDCKMSISDVEIESRIPSDGLGLPEVNIRSDIFNATLSGSINPATIAADLKELAANIWPSVVESPHHKTDVNAPVNSFNLSGRLLSTAPIEKIMKLPVMVRYPISFQAGFNAGLSTAEVTIDAPYLWQGNKEIDSTLVRIDANGSNFNMLATTSMPTKNGMMRLDVTSAMQAAAESDSSLRTLSSLVSWKVDAKRDFSGSIGFDLSAWRDAANPRDLNAAIDFKPSSLVFNDTVWTMEPSHIGVSKGIIDVDGFRVGRPGQYVEIDGLVTASHEDSVEINLANVDLDYVFETLNIPNAMFGGVASGKLYASGLLGPEMVAYTPDLFVKGLKYNFSLMGDTHIKASFDPSAPAVNIDAKVDQPNGLNSYITGYIKPTSEGYLDLTFHADKIEVGFMKPFMSAFASAVHGYASGSAHLFGTFHDVNMSGDIYAEDLSLTLDFTGTTYWATDSVHLTPGYIDLNGITLRDREGHTAKLGGFLRHTNFHEPRFQFRITDADDLLVYYLPESSDRRWFGTIYGDGSATITGEPGKIDIGVDMATAPRSSFTFILSDSEEAYDYNFITFRNRGEGVGSGILTEALAEGIPVEVAEMRKALAKKADNESASIYDMSISVAVSPDALLTVVMDPIGGDAIKARGSGALTMTYNSASEDLGLRGDYTLDNGTYNFTFQDIIRKDFRINPGSTIRFIGDPYAAQLDIEATYRLTANLSDLDESFLDDPELTRTSVPVDAMINVTGDMRAPEIAYDLGFPTLKDDVKRKVNSIVSTDEMRARQMLYLLALNRFYTPEYMSATKGNELFSVASSTISSQISNLLGSLSENWTIAPNLRSDRGDFSDVEFDLALSSSLLNNRLLFNGNFGYRDKNLNNNSFIGDFDLEYLLNRSGTLRLKAYNRYNDQNFYVKNALTTQGVGIVFRRDFDSFTSWLKALRRKKNKKQDNHSGKKND